mmetsp:Transcript_43315/g.101141  ORF Transcript_43315/g.101141 Transcript_43315/m.101141 type:complete len:535 (+) Transcript_43315:35-1639(+)
MKGFQHLTRALRRGSVSGASPRGDQWAPKDDSEDGSSEVDFEASHLRLCDPTDADVYNDALYAPLYLKYLRIQKDGPATPHVKDYLLAVAFLALNVVLQLAIAIKIQDVTVSTYGDIAASLFDKTCWRMDTNRQGLFHELWPPELEGGEEYFDCGQPILTLSASPKRLDLNRDGFWSLEEARQHQKRLSDLGLVEIGNFSNAHRRMVRYDLANNNVTRSTKGSLDMRFFTKYRPELKMCMPMDFHMCGNLELEGALPEVLSHLDLDPDERVALCKKNFYNFCQVIFGELFNWYFMTTQELCGAPSHELEDGISKTSYETVSVYTGEPDSILGSTFITFMVLILFVWCLIMLQEFRGIYNFAVVVWQTPSTTSHDETFAVSSADGKMQVKQLPWGHKVFALLFIASSRLLVALVLSYSGTFFLASTDNLLDLVLNSTALGFLIEVDAMIHAAFLTESFKNCIMQQMEPISIPVEERFPTIASLFSVVLTVCALSAFMYYLYHRRRGLQDIGESLQCLCHMEGRCLSRYLFEDAHL